MKIAQVAPLYESVPPRLYGGTERIVSYLTEELVRQGHDVTLFASGDSVTRARLVPCSPQSLRLDPDCRDPLAHHMVLLEEVFRRIRDFDVVHFHIDYLHYPLSRRSGSARLTTLHGRLDLPDLVPLYRVFRHEPLVSISDAQRRPLSGANWLATVHHGMPLDLQRGNESPGDYLAFLGRFSPEKGAEAAIEIARAAGLPLRMAAKVDDVDRAYFESRVAPLLEQDHVAYLGEITEDQKQEFLGGARALLFPIDWPEPFGLVMIEAMACGTPVVAFRRGSVPEVLEDGVTGFLVETVDEAVAALGRLPSLDRRRCRLEFERRFSVARMARDYVGLYERQIAARRAAREEGTVAPPDGEPRRRPEPGAGIPASITEQPAGDTDSLGTMEQA